MMNIRPISGTHSNLGNNSFKLKRETLDTILYKKCLAFALPYSTVSDYDPRLKVAASICKDFSKIERFYNEIKRTAIVPNCNGYIKYVEFGLSFSETDHLVTCFKKAGLLKSAVIGLYYVSIEVEPSAEGFLTKDFAVLNTVNELRYMGASDIRYDCKLRDTHTAKQLNIDIICQREQGGRAEFIMVIPNSRLSEYTYLNNVKYYKKIAAAAERLKGLTLIVSPSVDIVLLKRILAAYTKYSIYIVKLNKLRSSYLHMHSIA